MKTKKVTSRRDSDEAPVTFCEVAAYFSEEEWKLLHEWQKELYENVMKEIQQAVISLGPLIATTVFSLRPKEKEEIDETGHSYTDVRSMAPSPAGGTVLADDILKKTRRTSQCLKTTPVVDQREYQDVSNSSQENDGKSHQILSCEDISSMEQELESGYIDDYGAHIQASYRHPRLGHETVAPVVSFSVKEEGEMYSMDNPDSEERESTTSRVPCHGVDLETRVKEYRGEETEDSCISLTSGPDGATQAESFGINEEGETYPIDGDDCKKRNRIDSLADDQTKLGTVQLACGGTTERKHKNGASVLYVERTLPLKASSGKVKEKVIHRSQRRSYFRRQVWPEANWEVGGEKAAQSENGLENDAHSLLQQGNSEVGGMDNMTVPWNHLWSTHAPVGQLNTEHNWGLYTAPDCEKGPNGSSIEQQQTRTRLSLKENHFQCRECHKSFSQKRYLICHQRIHSEDRPYHCNECDKTFCHKHHLIGHQRTHSGEKPFQCTHCTKTFTWKDSLRRHARIHMEEV